MSAERVKLFALHGLLQTEICSDSSDGLYKSCDRSVAVMGFKGPCGRRLSPEKLTRQWSMHPVYPAGLYSAAVTIDLKPIDWIAARAYLRDKVKFTDA